MRDAVDEGVRVGNSFLQRLPAGRHRVADSEKAATHGEVGCRAAGGTRRVRFRRERRADFPAHRRGCGMSEIVSWIGAQAERFEEIPAFPPIKGKREKKLLRSRACMPEFSPASSAEGLRAHQFPAEVRQGEADGDDSGSMEELSYAELHELEVGREEERWQGKRRARELQRQEEMDREADLRRYRGRTVKLLRRYLRTAIETGRLPSILGSAFFRSGVTSYGVVTFEDRVIFVHDMEICLEKLGEFSRQIIARYVLQEHNLEDTARLLHCDEKTIRRNVSMVLDDCSEILLKMGLLERLDSNWENSCQGGKSDDFFASDC